LKEISKKADAEIPTIPVRAIQKEID